MLAILKQYKELLSLQLRNNQMSGPEGGSTKTEAPVENVTPSIDVVNNQARVVDLLDVISKFQGNKDLKKGSDKFLVIKLQSYLRDLGMDLGTSRDKKGAPNGIDGNYGPKTVEAVKILQNLLKIPATGVFDAITFAALGAALDKKLGKVAVVQETAEKKDDLVKSVDNGIDVLLFKRVLKKGAEGEDVKALQKALLVLNKSTGQSYMKASGKFDDATESELIIYQTSKKIKVDGKAGEQTFGEIEKDLALKGVSKAVPVKNIDQKEQGNPLLSASMLNEKGEYIEKRTKESVTKLHHSFMGIDLGELERSQALKGMDIDALLMFLSSENLGNVASDFKKSLGTENLTKYVLKSGDIDKIENILKKYNFDVPFFFNKFQADTILRMITDTQDTREKASNLSERDKMEIVFDFDGDGVLSMKKNFYITEQQAVYHAFESKTTDGIDAFFENIGLDKNVMLQEIGTNPTRARRDIATVIGAAFESGVKGAELFVKGNSIPKIEGKDHKNEYFTGVWETTNKEKDRERINTQKKMVASSEIISINGIDTLTMDTFNISMISDARKNPQAEIINGKIFVGGKVESLKVEEYIQGDRVDFILVIDGGVKNKDNYFTSTGNQEVTSTFESSGFTGSITEKTMMLDAGAIETTVQVRSYLSTMIESDTLQSPKTVGMLDLQKMIFDMKTTGNTSVEQAWDQFIKVVTNDGFVAYLKEKGNADKHSELLDSLKNAVTDAEKIMILQSMVGNFMKKGHLQVNEKGETVMKNKKGENVTIGEYEKENNRAKFFNEIFAEKYPTLLPQIKEARNNWMTVNKDKTTYTSQAVNDGGIAFTGVSSDRKGGKNIHEVLPFTGVYNIAGESVKIDAKSEEVINSIPNNVVENMRNFLNKKFGLSLGTVEAVKTFINAGGNKQVSVDYNLTFNKMGECLNDTVILENLTFTQTGSISLQTISDVNEAKYNFSTGANGGAGAGGVGGGNGGTDSGTGGGSNQTDGSTSQNGNQSSPGI